MFLFLLFIFGGCEALNITGNWIIDRDQGFINLLNITHNSDNTISFPYNNYVNNYVTGSFNQNNNNAFVVYYNKDHQPYWSQTIWFNAKGTYGYVKEDDISYFRSNVLADELTDYNWTVMNLARLLNRNPFGTCDNDKCLIFPSHANLYGNVQFMRDSYYSYMGGWGLLLNQTKNKKGIEFLLQPRWDGALPQFRGISQISYGNGSCDDSRHYCQFADSPAFATFLIELVASNESDYSFYHELEQTLVNGLNAVPSNEYGFVENTNFTENTVLGYGFHDSVQKNGSLFYSTVLHWSAFSIIHKNTQNITLKNIVQSRIDLIKSNINLFWNEKEGGYVATWPENTWESDKIDIWGNALIASQELIERDKIQSIYGLFHSRQDDIFFNGYVRPLLHPQKWNSLYIPDIEGSPSNLFPNHQNGSYWGSQLFDVIKMLALFDRSFACSILKKAVKVSRILGSPEWISPYFPYYTYRNPEYLATMGNIVRSFDHLPECA